MSNALSLPLQRVKPPGVPSEHADRRIPPTREIAFRIEAGGAASNRRSARRVNISSTESSPQLSKLLNSKGGVTKKRPVRFKNYCRDCITVTQYLQEQPSQRVKKNTIGPNASKPRPRELKVARRLAGLPGMRPTGNRLGG